MRSLKMSVVQEKGQVTIPAELRRKWGLKKGDVVSFEETEEGILIRPQEIMAADVLKRLNELLQKQGINLEDLLDV